MAFILLSRHRNLFGFDMDDIRLEHSTAPLVSLLDCQLMNPHSDIDGSDYDILLSTVLIIELNRIEIWNIPDEFPIVWNFPKYLRYFIWQFVGDPKIYAKSTAISWNKWKMSWNISNDAIPNRNVNQCKPVLWNWHFLHLHSNTKRLVQGF